MHSNTFKSATSDRVLRVDKTISGQVRLSIRDSGLDVPIALDPTGIPALMLALGAAMVKTESPYMFEVMSHLAAEVQLVAEAEAEAQAKLEAEALELFNEYRIATQLEPISSWDEAHPLAQEQWLAVTRRAREMGAEK